MRIPDVHGALIDVDGTLLAGDAAIPGAAEALRRLRERGILFRLATNTTRRPRAAIAEALGRAGIDVSPAEIVIPASLACRRITDSGRRRAALLIPESARIDLPGVEQVDTSPDWVVVGDLGRGFTFDLLNQAFRWLGAGTPAQTRLLALHKNRFWQAGDEGIVLDAGPFVAALEYASGVEAEVVGKPSPSFFELALADLGVPAGDVLCIGDSLVNDCLGAARAGCRTALVRTGIFDEEALARAPQRPDFVLDSIAQLPDRLDQ
mgnify:CR=1 FL=1